MGENKTIRSKYPVMKHDCKGILITVFDDDAELELDDVKILNEDIAKLCHGEPYGVLAISGLRMSASPEARKYSAANVPKGMVARAIVIRSTSVRLLGNFFLNFNKPKVSTKMFDDEATALVWLKKTLEKNSQKENGTTVLNEEMVY